MPTYGESVCFTIATVGSAVVVNPPSSSTPSRTPLLPAYSADRFSTSTAQAIACVSLAPFGTPPPNTRTCVAPTFSATSTHFLPFSTSALSHSASCCPTTHLPPSL